MGAGRGSVSNWSCKIPTLRMDSGLFDQLSDLMKCFDLLCDKGEDAISSFCDFQGVFPQNWLPPQFFWRLQGFALM